MGESARIYDVEALKAARGALAHFAEQVSGSLASIDADVQRVSQWLNAARPNHWKLEVRQRQHKVERIKGEIMRKRIVAAPDPASVVLEERRLDRAQERVEEARRRLAATQRWGPVWDREAMLYKSSTRGLTEALHSDIPRALAVLSAMMETLEDYATLAPPPGDPDAPPPAPGVGSAGPAAAHADDRTAAAPAADGPVADEEKAEQEEPP